MAVCSTDRRIGLFFMFDFYENKKKNDSCFHFMRL